MLSLKEMYPIEYDKNGKLKYNPLFHTNQGKPYKKSEEQYIIDWYKKIGPDEISYALGRTIHSIITKAKKLKTKGMLKGRARRHISTRDKRC